MNDDVLSRSFQQYLDVSHSSKRALSSVPGPMYHRKRFGRRQVTDLNSFQSLGSLPAWALPSAPDMSRWQWQPPKPGLWSPSPPPPPPPPPAPAPASAEAALRPPHPPQPPTPPEASAVRKMRVVQFEVGNKSLPWSGLRRELRGLHGGHRKTAREYRAGFESWSRTFAGVVSRGEISGSATADLCMAAHRFIEVASRVFPELHVLFGYFLSAIVGGIQSAKEKDPSFCIPTPLFWEAFSRQLDHLEINTFTTKHFIFAMHNTHSRHHRRALEIAFSHLDRYFDLWRGAELHGQPQFWDWAEILQTSHLASIWSGRVDRLLSTIQSNLAKGQSRMARINLEKAKGCASRVERFILKKAALMSDDWQLTQAVAEALEQKDPKHHKVLYRQATALLGKTKGWSRAHYNWLQVLARLPNIRTPQFKKLLDLFPSRGHAALSHTELCHLLLLHWSSQGFLQDPVKTRRRWKEIQGEKSDKALAALALAVNDTNPEERCTRVFWDFWGFLQTRAGKKTLLRQLAWLSRQQELSPMFLQRLAWTSNDNRTALLIYHVLSRKMGRRNKFWWPFWDKFIAKIRQQWKWPLIDPFLIPKQIIPPCSNRKRVEQRMVSLRDQHLEQEFREQMRVVEQETSDKHLASYHVTAPDKENRQWTLQIKSLKSCLELLRHARQITDRQALHYVTIFTSVLANKQGFLTARDLATLTSVIMRTLNQGKCGSLQRLKWYLGVIYRHLGAEACAQVGMILKRRRQANWRLWQMRLSITNQRLKQERDIARNLGRHTRSNGDRLARLWKLHVYDGRHCTMKRRRLARLKQSRLEAKQQTEN